MLDYCPKQGKQNSQHKTHARRATRTRAPVTKARHQHPTGDTNHRTTRPNVGHNTRPHAPYSTVSLPLSTSRETRTRTPNRAAHFECAMSTYSIRLASLSAHTSGASTSGGTRTHTLTRAPHFECGVSTNSTTEAKERERKQTRETTTRPQCAQPAGHTHTSRTTGQPNPRARTPSTGQPRPAQLTHQHREHPGANTQAPPAHTQRTTNAATPPA